MEFSRDTGQVFDIQRYAIHDGPGIRTLVFLKGCPLSCAWCCNPESQNPGPDLALFSDRCLDCRKCIKACPAGAISMQEEGGLLTNRTLCASCRVTDTGNFPCCEACVASARVTMGHLLTIEQVLEEVLRDHLLYKLSGGGVTVSGGEPLSQGAFLLGLLSAFRQNWLHTGLETSGFGKWEILREAVESLDLIYFDLKALTPESHRAFTGRTNELILSNAKALVAHLKKRRDPVVQLIFRVPVIPDMKGGPENVRRIIEFISHDLEGGMIEFMPYHRLGRGKYISLGRDYPLAELAAPRAEDLLPLEELARCHGLEVVRAQ